MIMARSLEFRDRLSREAIIRAAEGAIKGTNFKVEYKSGRAVVTDGSTEYRITPHDISETGPAHPLYDRLRDALRSASGVTHG